MHPSMPACVHSCVHTAASARAFAEEDAAASCITSTATNAIEIKQPATVTHVGTLSMPTHTCAPSIGEFRRSCAGVVQMLKISRFSRNTPYLVSFSQHCQRFHNYKLCGPAKKCSKVVQMPDKLTFYKAEPKLGNKRTKQIKARLRFCFIVNKQSHLFRKISLRPPQNKFCSLELQPKSATKRNLQQSATSLLGSALAEKQTN